MNTLGQRLRYARERKGLTQAVLATQSGTSQQAVNMAEQGKAKRPRALHEMATILGVSIDWLLSGREAGGMGQAGLLPAGQVSERAAVPMDGGQPSLRDLPVVMLSTTRHAGVYRRQDGVADYVERPPQLRGIDRAFAVPVQDSMMAPRYELGDMLLVHPGKTPRVGDNVCVQMAPAAGQEGDMLLAHIAESDERRLKVRFLSDSVSVPFELYRSRITMIGKIIGLYHV